MCHLATAAVTNTFPFTLASTSAGHSRIFFSWFRFCCCLLRLCAVAVHGVLIITENRLEKAVLGFLLIFKDPMLANYGGGRERSFDISRDARAREWGGDEEREQR